MKKHELEAQNTGLIRDLEQMSCNEAYCSVCKYSREVNFDSYMGCRTRYICILKGKAACPDFSENKNSL